MSPITLRLPSKYTTHLPPPSDPPFAMPPLPFLHRTWSVTHSTLRMWRSARNVRITYGSLAPSSSSRERMSDLVEYEALSGAGGVKTVAGVDTASSAGDTSVFDWRGSGWLFFVGSHWEVLGWGEREAPDGGVERWVVTWFAPTVFTAEGVDVYSDRREGGSEGVCEGKGRLGELVKEMREVKVELPWKEA
ncbi:hypothetical protein C8A05DRAFT_44028 [Staphylotrichum tortipilum]|uniref:Uncharacterized protein n=1 Tax=Staphylotrichum tortipilum TaxID=2831512 RepID=A0AAN6MLD7_9PEZI|nr:hypothetical protein C8A05DRAFT_44028 [Staphylotrichum longicolle]